jgi:hypothetical protein
VPVLKPDQFEQVRDILTDAFDKGGITELVRTKLGERLDKLVNPDQPTPQIVFDLLTWIDKRDMHTLENLLQGAIGMKPDNGALRAFCERDFPGALKPIDSKVFVQNLTSGLGVLIEMKDASAVRQTVGQVRAELEDSNKQINTLKKYKELHDCLHELEVRLSAIADAVVRAKEASARRSLGIYARDLRWLSERARAAIPNLPSRQSEEIWVPDLDACAEDIERARVSTIENAQDSLSDVPIKLRRLLTEANRINGFLAQLAGQLKLDSFSEAMDKIANRMRADTRPDDVSLVQLMTGSAAVSVLRSRITQLVHEHYEWQFLTTQLAAADTSPDRRPDKKIGKWPLFKTKLLALCDLAPLEESSQELRTLMERWVAVASATQQSESQIAAAEDAFAEFSHTCKLHFFEVDKQLKELCSKMTEVAMPLTALLSVIR